MKKLLQLLEDDCTLTTGQLASMAGMTEEEVKAAIRKYEEEKVILAIRPSWTGTGPTGSRSPHSSR